MKRLNNLNKNQNNPYANHWQQQQANLQQQQRAATMAQQQQAYSNQQSNWQAVPYPQQFPGGSTYPSTGGNMGPMNSNMDEEPTTLLDLQTLTVKEIANLMLPILNSGIVPFLWGPPGIGKSTLVRDLAKEQGWKLIDLRLSLLNPVDLRGLPVVDKENQQADWYPPSFLPKKGTKTRGILFLDEINLAPQSVQAAAYQLILDKRVGEYEFPDNWMIVAAGNRETDRANVVAMSAPLANRFVHFTIKEDFYTWAKWAEEDGIRQEIIDFLTFRPQYLLKMPNDKNKAFPSPRTWAFTSRLMDNFPSPSGVEKNIELKSVVVGTIGEAVASEFFKFLSTYDLKEVAAKVKDFIATGKLSMPTKTAERYAFSAAINDAHKAGKVDEEKFQLFLDKLNGEERATLLRVQYETLAGADEAYTFLTALAKANDLHIKVASIDLFNAKGGTAELMTSGGREIVHYTGINKPNKTINVGSRGVEGTLARVFSQGSVIRPLSTV